MFEALSLEIAQFGIRCHLFQLGFFRTKLMDHANIKAENDPASAIADYAELNSIVTKFVQQMNNNQPGDPKKAVKIMIDVVKGEGVAEGKTVPERLPIGSDIVEKLRVKFADHLEVCEEWGSVICSTDFDGEAEKGHVGAHVIG